MATQPHHTALDDLFGMATGVLLATVGLALLESADAVTGGTAGISLLLAQATGISLGVVLMVVTVPFLLLAVATKGVAFTLRTAAAVGAVSALTYLQPLVVDAGASSPVFAVACGNLLVGVGILVLFRHGSSLGGLNVVVLVLQERLGVSAGKVQMALDVLIVAVSLTVAPPERVALSAAGVVVLNLVLAVNHRTDRYVGTSGTRRRVPAA
ncbi:YitT family protein [Solicola sp. PLA-1-18]|uniref:YitT family protein n=1 Tax=Solicola sp. PLA-1-18 TaxID=3380532 RepID=UPI003B8044D1